MTITATALPELVHASGDPAGADVDVLVVAVRKRADTRAISAPGLGEESIRSLQEAADAIEFTAEAGTVARMPAPAAITASSVLLVGIGDAGALEAGEDSAVGAVGTEPLRRAAGSALRALASIESVALVFPSADAQGDEAVAVGALLGAYRYTAYSSAEGPAAVRRIVVYGDETARPGLGHAAVIASAAAAARDLVNQPPSDLYPASFADAVVQRAGEAGPTVAVRVVDDEELRARGFGGLTGVGSGSPRGPRLVKLSYTPANAAQHIAFVGKGITFDSGGLSLKQASGMEHMKSDMAGAAAAAQALFAIAELGLSVRVTAWLALAENMPSGSAVRPGDVLRIYGGKTVEVMNTDAEGRLVLADAIVAAQEEEPDLLVDIATLTGAQVVALGRRTSGVMGTPAARERVLAAAERSGEPTWGMPIPEELIRGFESHTADLKNIGTPGGGMLAAAAFLREFVKDDAEWAHLDIAGPAYNADAAHGYTPLGGTGVPVRTLVELARAFPAGGTHRSTE